MSLIKLTVSDEAVVTTELIRSRYVTSVTLFESANAVVAVNATEAEGKRSHDSAAGLYRDLRWHKAIGV